MKKRLKELMNLFGIETNTTKGRLQLAYKNEIQKLRDVMPGNVATVLDIGANTGQFASLARVAFPQSTILSFEPIHSCYEELLNNFSSDRNFKAFNYAIGKSSRTSVFNLNEYAPSSSMLAISAEHIDHFPKTANTSRLEIEERQFSELIKLNDVQVPCLIKIDVQGYELELIQHNADMLLLADTVLIETSFVQLYQNQPLFHEVYSVMYQLGFTYAGSYEQLYEPGSFRIIQCDAIFRKG